ncbi:hypothetical protein KEM54_002190 [Ascosphaera aggregata]|nr:hypothetical protein KEM54_002190 [Ascosphaera aggregata]
MNEQIQEIPLDELIRSYNIAAEMHDESLANVPDKAAVVVSDLQSEKLEVEPEVKPETTPAEQDVQDAAAPAQKADTQSIIQGKKSVKSDKLPSELFTSSELNLDFNFDLNKSISYDTALKDKELQLPAETQRPSSRSSSQRPHSSQVESISENDKDAGSSGRGFTSRHRHTRTASSKLSAFGLGESRTAKRRNKDLLGDEAESALGVDFEGSRSLSLDVPSQSQRSQSQYSVPTDKEAQRVLPSGEFSAAGAATDYFASDSTVPATTSHIVTPKVIISSNGSSDNGPVAFSEIKDLDLSLNLPATPSLAPRPATSTGISPEVVSSGISILSAEDSSSRKLSKRRQASRSFSVEPARSIKEKSKKMLEGKKNAKKDGKSTCFCM